MSRITRVEILQVDLIPLVVRTDAVQSFVKQETPMVRISTDDGLTGTGYAYTIGSGGSSVVAMLRDHLAPRLIGRDPLEIEAIWKDLFFSTHATAVGAITALALATIDIALWDLKCLASNRPLWLEAGGAQKRVPVYTTEGGWLHIEPQALIDDALKAREAGFTGVKIKVGRPHVSEDVARLTAVREAMGPGFEIMVDANQAFTVSEAIRRAKAYEPLDLAWFEEPLPAEDLDGHIRLSASTTLPIAVGESMYHPSHFREYMQKGACSIVQADVARIGGITPWLKVAHAAEGFNMSICPHFLMEIHVSLTAAVPNARWVEWIPQLEPITHSRMSVVDGCAVPPSVPGIGIDWDWKAIEKAQQFTPIVIT
jgi:L-alanine-DL-glutamate epimerase-like enolase superfamily enzyme